MRIRYAGGGEHACWFRIYVPPAVPLKSKQSYCGFVVSSPPFPPSECKYPGRPSERGAPFRPVNDDGRKRVSGRRVGPCVHCGGCGSGIHQWETCSLKTVYCRGIRWLRDENNNINLPPTVVRYIIIIIIYTLYTGISSKPSLSFTRFLTAWNLNYPVRLVFSPYSG